MARKAATAQPEVPQAPPQRITRARTRTAINKAIGKLESDIVDVQEATAPAKRGRPKTKTGDTSAKPTSKISKPSTVAPEAILPKKRGPKPKTKEVKLTSLDEELSDDDMNVVPVRMTVGTRLSARRREKETPTTSTTCSLERKKTVSRTKQTRKVDQKDDQVGDDDDDDELAGSQPMRRSTTPKAATTTARKPSTASKETKSCKKSTARSSIAEPGLKPVIHVLPGSLRLRKAEPGKMKKKVTFLDITEDSDKENLPLKAPKVAKNKSKPEVGLTAQPVRRRANPVTETITEKPKEPLSPKKATQVTKSTVSDSSEICPDDDDVFGTISCPPIRSPSKTSSGAPGLTSPTKRIDLASPMRPPSRGLASSAVIEDIKEENTANGSRLLLFHDTEMGASPAKRPPPSPFQCALRQSPIKAPVFKGSKLFLQADTDALEQTRTSPLKESPKKVKLDSLNQSSQGVQISPTKNRQSPLKNLPRRPQSPMKFPPLQQTIGIADQNTTPICASNSSEADIASPMEISTPPRTPNVLDKGIDEDITRMADLMGRETQNSCRDTDSVMDFLTTEETHLHPDLKDVCPESPLDILTPAVENGGFWGVETSSRCETIASAKNPSSVRTPACILSPALSPPLFSRPNPEAFNYRENTQDEESEAESMIASPTRRPLRTKSCLGSPSLESTQQHTDIGFTPLANKLSGWAASSPEKRNPGVYGQRGLFSPEIRREGSPQRNSQRSFPSPVTVVSNSLDDISIFEEKDSVDMSGVVHNVIGDFEGQSDINMDSNSAMDASESELPEVFEDVYGYENIPLQEQTIIMNLENFEEEDISIDLGPINQNEQPGIFEGIYGDENAPPQEPNLYEDIVSIQETLSDAPQQPSLPMSITPVRRISTRQSTAHAICKVPLKPDEHESLNIPRKRSRSSIGSKNPTPLVDRSRTLPSPRKNRSPLKSFDATLEDGDCTENQPYLLPERTKPSTWSGRRSPIKSPSKNKPESDSKTLQGAVIFVDVHTAEGADASGIFIELLTQMGAKPLKSWNWNPRSSMSPVDGVDPRDAKVGITHVVYKDGGIRTLEKVREANGVVKCVGVGWVLDCERENKWVDETNYTVDLSMIPRGGGKRRKSMEPRALSNMNGTLVSSVSSASGRRGGVDQEAVQEFMRLSPTPQTPRYDSTTSGMCILSTTDDPEFEQQPETPKQRFSHAPVYSTPEQNRSDESGYAMDFEGTSVMSPTTPYYLSAGAKLVQQTCPPKQSRQGLFPLDREVEEEQDRNLKFRLEAARRRSLVWKPKIGSPLGKQYI
ncbi:hypothetical protein FQN57_003468 [Myotisia sp. PD_48]|nr:hypothetical protein FQN57_003468 [Myotisia sp. PD_48]